MTTRRPGRSNLGRKGAKKGDDGVPVKVQRSDMGEQMQKKFLEVSRKAFAEKKLEKDVALQVKKAFDEEYPSSTWHCIVGNHFACSITHCTKYMMFAKINQQTVLLFRSLD